jgi:hypothetical protein
MRNLTYRIMFLLVASGSIVQFITPYLIGRSSFFLHLLFLTGFAQPLNYLLLTVMPFSPPIVALRTTLKVILLLLVLHRVYRIFRERHFNVPPIFKHALFLFGAIGVSAFCLWVVLIAGSSGNFLIGLVSVLFFGLTTFILPIVFLVTEVLCIKELVAHRTRRADSQSNS